MGRALRGRVWFNLSMRVTVVAAILLAGAVAAGAQEQARFPDWSGQWVRGPGMGFGWDPTRPPGLGQQAPLTPEYRLFSMPCSPTRRKVGSAAIGRLYACRTGCRA